MGVIVLFLFAAVISLFFTFFVRLIALSFGWVDKPSPRKLHDQPVPLFGGIAIVMVFLLMNFFAFSAEVHHLLLISLFGIIALLLLGIWDAFLGWNPYLKMGLLFLVGFITALFIARTHFFPYLWMDVIFTTVWVAGVTNAFNYIDNMDGLAAGLAMVAGLCFALVAYGQGQFALSVYATCLSGACCGFLFFNFNPAKIFMGDVGSYFLGYVLAFIGLQLQVVTLWQIELQARSAWFLLGGFLIPIMIVGVPIFDTLMVTILRPLNSRKIVQAGKDHCSHRLINCGFSQKMTALILYGIQLALGLVAFMMLSVDLYQFLRLLSVVVVFFIGFAVFLFRVKVYS